MGSFTVVGMDPSMRNWGLAVADLDLIGSVFELQVNKLELINPVITKSKQVRQNSKDMEGTKQIVEQLLPLLKGAKFVFVEVPVGSQSARAMMAYGACIGILGSLRALGNTFIEVTPTEVKKEATGKATASKREMIQWAYEKHPEAPWPMHKLKGELVVSEGKAEHMADAIGAIYAGMRTNEFSFFMNHIQAA